MYTYFYVSADANLMLNDMYKEYKPASCQIVRNHIKLLYDLANSLPQFRVKWCLNGIFDLSNIAESDVISFIKLINNNEGGEIIPNGEILKIRSPAAIYSSCKYLISILKAYKSEMAYNILVNCRIKLIEIHAYKARTKREQLLYHFGQS
jgi:hypothetical protein